jgi:hypothetical protein
MVSVSPPPSAVVVRLEPLVHQDQTFGADEEIFEPAVPIRQTPPA